jgi:hypothetical protein
VALRGKSWSATPPVANQEALAAGAKFTGQLEALTAEPTVTHMVLLIPSIKALILCTSADVEEGKIINTNEGLIKVKFLGCQFRQQLGEKEGEEIKSCPINAGAGIVATAKFLPKLHEIAAGVNELFLLFEGDPTTSAIATLKLGAECAFGASVDITGSVVALVKEGNVQQITKLITFSEAIQKLFQIRNEKGEFVEGDRLLFGTAEAFIDGNATASLIGLNHQNLNWSTV